MKCEQIRERLDDYVAATLNENDEATLLSHLAACAACAAEERGLRSLLRQATELPREMQPARDLWPGIAARLGRRAKLLGFQPRATHLAWLAAAAAIAIALSATLTTRTGGIVPASQAPRLVPAGFDGVQGVLAAERGFEQAAATLMQALERDRGALSPETLKVVEENLLLIDNALADVRRALEKDPASRELTSLLTATHRRKLETLQRVVRLSQL